MGVGRYGLIPQLSFTAARFKMIAAEVEAFGICGLDWGAGDRHALCRQGEESFPAAVSTPPRPALSYPLPCWVDVDSNSFQGCERD